MADADPGTRPAGPNRRQRISRFLWSSGRPFLLGSLGMVVGIYAFTRLDDDPAPADSEDVGAAVTQAFEEFLERPANSALVYQAILPSLVYITTGGDGQSSGLGSGVIINQDGSILTAYHVVGGAATISVVFADGTRASARIASAEPENDLAILQADAGPEVIVPAVLGGGVNIGDEAYAAGNPLGLVASLSAGVVSGLDREITTPGGGKLSGLIQFDAAVNPGSSGGPLLNRAGQVVGIVTALANPSKEDSFLGIGFAIPLGSGGGAGDGPPR